MRLYEKMEAFIRACQKLNCYAIIYLRKNERLFTLWVRLGKSDSHMKEA